MIHAPMLISCDMYTVSRIRSWKCSRQSGWTLPVQTKSKSKPSLQMEYGRRYNRHLPVNIALRWLLFCAAIQFCHGFSDFGHIIGRLSKNRLMTLICFGQTSDQQQKKNKQKIRLAKRIVCMNEQAGSRICGSRVFGRQASFTTTGHRWYITQIIPHRNRPTKNIGINSYDIQIANMSSLTRKCAAATQPMDNGTEGER